MTRKRRNHSKISLFAFQDVMASVIGVLFFVVLLMSLDIVESATESYENRKQYETVIAELQTQILSLDLRRQDILEEINLLEKQIIIVSTKDDQEILDEIGQHERNLKVLYSQLEQNQISTNELLKKLEENKQLYSKKIRQYGESNHRITELKGQLVEQTNSPSLAYIIDSKLDMTPWLVELTGNNIRVASHDMTTVVEFNAVSQDSRERLFMEWVKSRDIQSDYLVILIKPSGLDLFEDSFRKRITELGFDIGTDLVPENKRIF